MSFKNTATQYGSIAKFFHWTVFGLLFLMILFGYSLSFHFFPKADEPFLKNIHKLIGLLVLLLMTLRLVWTLSNPKPTLPGIAGWQRSLERVVHFLLYVAAIAIPLSGWIGSVAGGRPPYLGNLIFSLPIPANKVIVSTAFSLHNYFAMMLIVLFFLHVSGALYHHFISKDDVLRRMMFGNQS